jgi:hypothetical protein
MVLWACLFYFAKFWVERNRYEAGAAGVFVGGAGADCDFAFVCVNSTTEQRMGSRWLRDGVRQDAAAGRGESRPYKESEDRGGLGS